MTRLIGSRVAGFVTCAIVALVINRVQTASTTPKAPMGCRMHIDRSRIRAGSYIEYSGHRAQPIRFAGSISSSPFARRASHGAAEDAREVTLIGKATRQRDIGGRRLRISQQLLRFLHAPLHQPPMRRHAGALLEGLHEV